MRKGKVFYNELLAGIITETNDGEYIFQYDEKYVKDHSNDFLTFTMPVRNDPYKNELSFPIF